VHRAAEVHDPQLGAVGEEEVFGLCVWVCVCVGVLMGGWVLVRERGCECVFGCIYVTCVKDGILCEGMPLSLSLCVCVCVCYINVP
jgi:hypothetical protein